MKVKKIALDISAAEKTYTERCAVLQQIILWISVYKN